MHSHVISEQFCTSADLCSFGSIGITRSLQTIVETAIACVRSGVHGLTLIDGVPAMGVEAASMRAALGGATGYLSGPAVRPLALRAIYEVASALPDVPILGVGGVSSGTDAVEMLLAGAWAVQVGTAVLVDPAVPARVAKGIGEYLGTKGLASPDAIRGRVRVSSPVLPSREEPA